MEPIISLRSEGNISQQLLMIPIKRLRVLSILSQSCPCPCPSATLYNAIMEGQLIADIGVEEWSERLNS
jgi:hypothetical protein